MAGRSKPIRSLVTSRLAVCVFLVCLYRSVVSDTLPQPGSNPAAPDSQQTGNQPQKSISQVLQEPNNKEAVDNIKAEILKQKIENARRPKNPRYKVEQATPVKRSEMMGTHYKQQQQQQQQHLPKNPAFEFIKHRRPAPAAEVSKNGSLASEFNKINRLTQRRHPSSDFKDGGLNINWHNDMFFIKWGYSHVAEKIKVRRSPHPSTGAPWPLPQRYARNDKLVFRVEESFKFLIKKQTCDIVEEAVERFRKIILEDSVEDLYDNLQNAENTNLVDPGLKYKTDTYRNAPLLANLEVWIEKPCDKYPSLHMDES